MKAKSAKYLSEYKQKTDKIKEKHPITLEIVSIWKILKNRKLFGVKYLMSLNLRTMKIYAFSAILKFILAFLNSKLSKWYFERISTMTGMGTTRWLIYKIELLPIPLCNDEQLFIDLVDKILLSKKENPQADTTELERNIDEMVYALYGLSEEEIAVVEGKSK